MASDEIVDINVYTLQLLREMCPGMEEIQMNTIAKSLIERAAAEVARREKARRKKVQAIRKLQGSAKGDNPSNNALRETPILSNTSKVDRFTSRDVYQQQCSNGEYLVDPRYRNQGRSAPNGYTSYNPPRINHNGYGRCENSYTGNPNHFAQGEQMYFSAKPCFRSNQQSLPFNSMKKRKISHEFFSSKRMRS